MSPFTILLSIAFIIVTALYLRLRARFAHQQGQLQALRERLKMADFLVEQIPQLIAITRHTLRMSPPSTTQAPS